VQQGEQFGFIKFGSRVDIFLPLGTKVKVNINDVVKGGRTVLAELTPPEGAKVVKAETKAVTTEPTAEPVLVTDLPAKPVKVARAKAPAKKSDKKIS
jgi:phosphatidylserine decarboxylase